MRIRLIMKMVSTVVMLVLTVVTARSCQSSSAGSPLNPATLEQDGFGGLCANQASVAAAAGDDSAQTLAVPGVDSAASQLPVLHGLAGGSFSCATTTSLGG